MSAHACMWVRCVNAVVMCFLLLFFVDYLLHFKVDHWIITFRKGLGHLPYPMRMLMVLKFVVMLVQMLEGIYRCSFLYGGAVILFFGA